MPEIRSACPWVGPGGLGEVGGRVADGRVKRQIGSVMRASMALPGVVAAVALLAGSAQPAEALPILTPAYETQLETWFGGGPLDFTMIFEKTLTTSSSSDFHAAVDGKGPTFTVIQAVYNGQDYAIGGFNPQSWSSIDDYNRTPLDADRRAFIYNLTNSVMLAQRLSTVSGDPGQTQTFNAGNFGPSFGGGSDLYVDSQLASGTALQHSYGNAGGCFNRGADIFGVVRVDSNCVVTVPGSSGFTVQALEVYTFAPTSGVPVPEPTSMLLVGTGLAGMIASRRRRASPRQHRAASPSPGAGRQAPGDPRPTSRIS